MTTLEDRVRDALRADAETVRPGTIPDAPSRPTRRALGRTGFARSRILIPVSAAAAVAAVVTGVAVAVPHGRVTGSGTSGPSPSLSGPSPGSHPCRSALASLFCGNSSPPVSNAPLPQAVLGDDGQPASKGVPASAPSPGVPPYYVTLEPGSPTSEVVRRSASAAKSELRTPPHGTSFGAITATAGDRTFVTALTSNGSTCPARSELYQYQPDGQQLTPLNIEIPGNFTEFGTLAITPDGRTIAYDTWLCGQNRSEVGVIDLASGQARVWEVPGFTHIMGLSLSADGSLLAYENLSGGAAILRTNAPSGSLFQRSQIVSRSALWAALASDGTTLYTCSVAPSPLASQLPAKAGRVTYYAQTLSGGGPRVIASWNNLPYPQCWASLEPDGHYLLVQYPVAVPGASDWVQPAVLDINNGQLTRIHSPGISYYGPLDVAW